MRTFYLGELVRDTAKAGSPLSQRQAPIGTIIEINRNLARVRYSSEYPEMDELVPLTRLEPINMPKPKEGRSEDATRESVNPEHESLGEVVRRIVDEALAEHERRGLDHPKEEREYSNPGAPAVARALERVFIDWGFWDDDADPAWDRLLVEANQIIEANNQALKEAGYRIVRDDSHLHT